jgi:hypothetical protein
MPRQSKGMGEESENTKKPDNTISNSDRPLIASQLQTFIFFVCPLRDANQTLVGSLCSTSQRAISHSTAQQDDNPLRNFCVPLYNHKTR